MFGGITIQGESNARLRAIVLDALYEEVRRAADSQLDFGVTRHRHKRVEFPEFPDPLILRMGEYVFVDPPKNNIRARSVVRLLTVTR